MLWVFLGVVFLSGASGGIVNALLSDNGFVLPRYARGMKILRPGFFGNMLIGGFSAAISWGLYGPFAGEFMLGESSVTNPQIGLTLSGVVGAVLVGIGGARWLTNEVDKGLLRASGSQMAVQHNDPKMAKMFALEEPAELLRMQMTADDSQATSSE